MDDVYAHQRRGYDPVEYTVDREPYYKSGRYTYFKESVLDADSKEFPGLRRHFGEGHNLNPRKEFAPTFWVSSLTEGD